MNVSWSVDFDDGAILQVYSSGKLSLYQKGFCGKGQLISASTKGQDVIAKLIDIVETMTEEGETPELPIDSDDDQGELIDEQP